MANFFTKLLGIKDDQPEAELGKNIVYPSYGSSGTEIYHGYITEEYLSELRDDRAADVYDKMRRSDTQIKMVLSAVKNPIKKANWYIEEPDETVGAEYLTEFIEHCLMNDLGKSWRKTLHECLSMIDFGYAAFEVTHKIVQEHPQFGTYVGLKSLGWRSPRTLDRFNVKDDGTLKSISQSANGDLGRHVDIPAEFIYLFSLDAEGDNYAGISMLRSCYGAWLRKQKYLKYMAIGIERSAVPTPIGTIPDGKQDSPEYDIFKQILSKYASHETQYITKPSGWEIDFIETKFEPEKVSKAVEVEDKAIVKSFLANFLELGLSGGGGSYALSFDQSDFFLGGIEHIADVICEVFNNEIIPDLIKMNFGEMKSYPKLCYAGISDKVGKEFAEIVKILLDGKAIVADEKLDEFLRKKYDLPDADPLTARKQEPPPTMTFSEQHGKTKEK